MAKTRRALHGFLVFLFPAKRLRGAHARVQDPREPNAGYPRDCASPRFMASMRRHDAFTRSGLMRPSRTSETSA